MPIIGEAPLNKILESCAGASKIAFRYWNMYRNKRWAWSQPVLLAALLLVNGWVLFDVDKMFFIPSPINTFGHPSPPFQKTATTPNNKNAQYLQTNMAASLHSLNPDTGGPASSSPLNAPQSPIEWLQTIELGYTDANMLDNKPQVVCFGCGATHPKLLKCGRCGVASYCQKDCKHFSIMYRVFWTLSIRIGSFLACAHHQDKLTLFSLLFLWLHCNPCSPGHVNDWKHG